MAFENVDSNQVNKRLEEKIAKGDSSLKAPKVKTSIYAGDIENKVGESAKDLAKPVPLSEEISNIVD